MKIYWVYSIFSPDYNRIYIGLSKNPEKRLLEHNKGITQSTRAFRPWILIYKRKIGSRKEARKEELRLKSGYGREFLRSLINKKVIKNIPG